MRNSKQAESTIPRQTLRRMPQYLFALREVKKQGVQTVSAPKIAETLDLNEVQVRKDIACVSSCAGKPKMGFSVDRLISDIEAFLGYDNVVQAIVIGAGHVGSALLQSGGFAECGMKITAAFDADDRCVQALSDLECVFPMSQLEAFCQNAEIRIGIICVPPEQAQYAADRLIGCGIRAIWNFAPTHLHVPQNTVVQNENLASSLAVLTEHLKQG